MEDLALRALIYGHFAESGRAPSFDQVSEWTGSQSDAADALGRLHGSHAIVLDADGTTIAMALPFSARPTGHTVESLDQQWWANCAWDSLAIPAALDIDATIDAQWIDDGTSVDLAVIDGELNCTDGFVQFEIPASKWWENIAET